jgi:xanthine dehydrogenase accessory factor
MALAQIARILEFGVTIVDPFLSLAEAPQSNRILHRLDFTLLSRNEHRFFVIASRGQFDQEGLEQALASDARYVGLIAGKSRREELMHILKASGLQEQSLARLRAPAGLNIGAETPEEIALSIMAEIVLERNSAKDHAASRK